MKLEAPFLPDAGYTARLAELGDRLDSVHFALPGSAALDARQQPAPDERATLDALQDLRGPDVFLLLNGRMLPPQRYLDTEAMAALAARLERLVDEIGLRGIVIADFHLLNALSGTAPDTCSRLEAVPSVNTMIDAPAKARAVLDVIAASAFRPPSRVVLDRSLNRNRDGLARTADAVRKRFPGSAIVLLANEGCLPHCPYKAAHDAHISLVSQRLCADRTFEANRRYACLSDFFERPERILASPFIRPEDAEWYQDHADVLKICGRTRGAGFLTRAVEAYEAGRWNGNLLDLLDAVGDAADRLWLDNAALPDDFPTLMSGCELDCPGCGRCASLLATAFHRKTVDLRAF